MKPGIDRCEASRRSCGSGGGPVGARPSARAPSETPPFLSYSSKAVKEYVECSKGFVGLELPVSTFGSSFLECQVFAGERRVRHTKNQRPRNDREDHCGHRPGLLFSQQRDTISKAKKLNSACLLQGIDDALALILAVAAGLTLEGVTIVFGNGNDVKRLGTNAKCILRNVGESTIPVHLGASGPLVVSVPSFHDAYKQLIG